MPTSDPECCSLPRRTPLNPFPPRCTSEGKHGAYTWRRTVDIELHEKRLGSVEVSTTYLSKGTLEQLLHGGGVRQAGRSLRLPHGRYRTKGNGHVIRNPFDELGGVLSLKVEDRLLGFLRRNFASENGRRSQIAAVEDGK